MQLKILWQYLNLMAKYSNQEVQVHLTINANDSKLRYVYVFYAQTRN